MMRKIIFINQKIEIIIFSKTNFPNEKSFPKKI